MLQNAEAMAIADIVANDPEAARRIDSKIDDIIPASWAIAGGLRNSGYVLLGIFSLGKLGDPTEPEYASRVCTGISDAASLALNKGRRRDDPRLRNLIGAEPISRLLNGIDHTAVQITMIDGQKHIFDWHATLNAKNPLLFATPAHWLNGQEGVLLQNFRGWK